MFGCRSTSVAHPNRPSLTIRPTTNIRAEAASHSQRVAWPQNTACEDPEGQRHDQEDTDPLDSQIPLHRDYLAFRHGSRPGDP